MATNAKIDKKVGEERKRPRGALSKKSYLSLIMVSGIAAIALIWAFVATFTDFGRTMHPEQQKTAEKVVKETRAVSGKTAEQDQKDALAAATKLLNQSGKSPNGTTATGRLQELSKGNFNVMDKQVAPMVQFSPSDSKDFQASTYQSLVTLYTVISEKNQKTNLTPVAQDSFKKVSLNQKIGAAYVPLSLYAQGGAAFSMEMIYVDGQWKLAPYTMVDAIKFSAALANSTSAQSSASAQQK